MKFTQRARGIVQTIAVVLSLALPLVIGDLVGRRPDRRRRQLGFPGIANLFRAADHVDRAECGAAVQPHHHPAGQPRPGRACAAAGFFNRPGMGMLGGLAAGFLGAGLLGMLFGGGMFCGLGGLSSIIGLILQIGLIIIVVRLAMSWWQRRHATAVRLCRPGPAATRRAVELPHRDGVSDWDRAARRSRSCRATTKPSSGCSARSRPRGRTRTSPGCIRWRRPRWCRISPQDLADNKAQNVVNTVSDVKLLQGDLAEAWREGETDFASVALRFSLIDKTIDRATGRLVEGSEQPTEATEVWTFLRAARRQLGTLGDPADLIVARGDNDARRRG